MLKNNLAEDFNYGQISESFSEKQAANNSDFNINNTDSETLILSSKVETFIKKTVSEILSFIPLSPESDKLKKEIVLATYKLKKSASKIIESNKDNTDSNEIFDLVSDQIINQKAAIFRKLYFKSF